MGAAAVMALRSAAFNPKTAVAAMTTMALQTRRRTSTAQFPADMTVPYLAALKID